MQQEKKNLTCAFSDILQTPGWHEICQSNSSYYVFCFFFLLKCWDTEDCQHCLQSKHRMWETHNEIKAEYPSSECLTLEAASWQTHCSPVCHSRPENTCDLFERSLLYKLERKESYVAIFPLTTSASSISSSISSGSRRDPSIIDTYKWEEFFSEFLKTNLFQLFHIDESISIAIKYFECLSRIVYINYWLAIICSIIGNAAGPWIAGFAGIRARVVGGREGMWEMWPFHCRSDAALRLCPACTRPVLCLWQWPLGSTTYFTLLCQMKRQSRTTFGNWCL